MMIKFFKIVFAFLITTMIMSAVNFVAQIALIFMDLLSRWESSSALIVVLWIVTGVFASIFTEGIAGLFINKKEITYRLVHYPVLVVSVMAMVMALVFMFQGHFISDVAEYTLLFSNGFVFVSYFLGAAVMSFIGRNL